MKFIKKIIWLVPFFFVLVGCATPQINLTQEQASQLPTVGQIGITLPNEKQNKIEIVNNMSLFVVYRSTDRQDYKKRLYLFIRINRSDEREYVVNIPDYKGYTIDNVSLLLMYKKENDSTVYADAVIYLGAIYDTDQMEIEKLKNAQRYHNGDRVEFIFGTLLQPKLNLKNLSFYTDKTIVYGSGLSSV